MRLTNTAEVYFVDHDTKTTTWDDPRLPSSLPLLPRLGAIDDAKASEEASKETEGN